MRVVGHELRSEGAAYEVMSDGRGRRIKHNTISGEGRGLCSCGIFSEMLPSGNARRKWHFDHKKEVRASYAKKTTHSSVSS